MRPQHLFTGQTPSADYVPGTVLGTQLNKAQPAPNKVPQLVKCEESHVFEMPEKLAEPLQWRNSLKGVRDLASLPVRSKSHLHSDMAMRPLCPRFTHPSIRLSIQSSTQ